MREKHGFVSGNGSSNCSATYMELQFYKLSSASLEVKWFTLWLGNDDVSKTALGDLIKEVYKFDIHKD